jgi:hypothetical protein
MRGPGQSPGSLRIQKMPPLARFPEGHAAQCGFYPISPHSLRQVSFTGSRLPSCFHAPLLLFQGRPVPKKSFWKAVLGTPASPVRISASTDEVWTFSDGISARLLSPAKSDSHGKELRLLRKEGFHPAGINPAPAGAAFSTRAIERAATKRPSLVPPHKSQGRQGTRHRSVFI